ncbi:MAG TPA: acyltransferase family protein [Nocardioides sp.]|nr:acyltransferase family protein [Nocardioides sp.]
MTGVADPVRAGASAETPPRSRKVSALRPDIEGLRAVAVGSVLLYHAGLAWIPGGFAGVDIFFVISGFLITSLMLREVETTGRLRLGAFWARRARRLLPASTVVLLTSALITVFCLPAGSRKDFGGDIIAAAAYVVNWRLGFREVNYLAEDVGASPVQHYWSLAVEEQFYVIWPLIIGLIVLLVARRQRRRAIFGVVLAITAVSFAWSLHYSVAWPGLAFFVSTTRAWELGVGALLAALHPVLMRRIPAVGRIVLGVLGLCAIAIVFVAYDATWPWPNVGTLLPVLGAAAVIVAGGTTGSAPGTSWLLSLRPAVWIGGLSYSLYLWHWPLLVAAHGLWGDHLRVRYTLLVVLVSVVPAWLSHHFLEAPIRHSPRWAPTARALWLGAATTATSVVIGLVVVLSFHWVHTVPLATAQQAPGAAVLLDPSDTTDWASIRSVSAMRPSPLVNDEPSVYRSADCTAAPLGKQNTICAYGPADADHVVVLVGDSKAAQWFTPVKDLAVRNGWRLEFINKGSCEFANVIRVLNGVGNPTCDAWSQWALDTAISLHPDLVLTTTRYSTAVPVGGDLSQPPTQRAMVDGLVSHWRALSAAGAVVVPLVDTPARVGGEMPECVQAHLHDLQACTYRLKDGLAVSGAPAQYAAAARLPQVHPVDLTDFICPDHTLCPPVIGNVLVYRSGTHLSDTYATTLEPMLSDRLARATNGLFGERLTDQP